MLLNLSLFEIVKGIYFLNNKGLVDSSIVYALSGGDFTSVKYVYNEKNQLIK